jgi:hypothetical protein
VNERGGSDIDTLQSHYRRLIEEVAALIGHPEQAEPLFHGGQLQIGERHAWFVYNEDLDVGHVYVYVDIGVPAKVPEAYRQLLRFNLQLLGSGVFGTTGLHPDNDHVIYAYRYPLAASSSGQGLMESLLKVVNGISVDALPTAVPDGTARTH